MLSYDEIKSRYDKIGKYMGSRTNPEVKKFGKRVVFPVNNFVRDDFGDERVQMRDEYLREIIAKEERKATDKQQDLDMHRKILHQIQESLAEAAQQKKALIY